MKKTKLGTGDLHPEELKAVYAISRAVASTVDLDQALAEIVRLSRPIFIFDNVVLYLQNPESGLLEPAFARAIGRGRSSEADLSWGNRAAQEAFSSEIVFLSEAKPDPNTDRLEQGYYLGLPMLVGGKTIGALVFIRFGGPTYSAEQINLAEFIAAHVTQVLERQRLVERVANLEAGRRLAQLQSDFLATVSHDLKTPLGFIKGYATTLLREEAKWSPEEQRDFLSIIDEETDHLNALVENLLESSRLQSGTLPMDFQNINLSELAFEIVERLRVRFADIEIKFDTQAEALSLFADPKGITQVLENLISNASKYAPQSTVQIVISEEEDKALIRVTDNGPGIPKEHQEQIFERFYRIPNKKESVRGSGLGLYICEQIVLAHQGLITVESAKGNGTTFTIELPLQKEAQLA